MTLYIDTTQWEMAVIRLEDDHENVLGEWRFEAGRALSDKLLRGIDELLKEHAIAKEDLSEIQVVPGPGSFTGTRIGVAVANSISFALQIPINGQANPVIPVYDKEPAITPPK